MYSVLINVPTIKRDDGFVAISVFVKTSLSFRHIMLK